MALPSSINLADASTQRWDALVIGAGPAGSLAALGLARYGHAVLLVDRACFPRPKVCGCCLNRRALATLAEVGLGDLGHLCRAAVLTNLRLAASDTYANVPFAGAALSRDAFDAALLQAAQGAGARFLAETRAQLAPDCVPNERIAVLRQHGRDVHVKSQIVIVASGLGSNWHTKDERGPAIVASESRLGAGVIAEQAPSCFDRETVYMACARGGYVGLVRLEDGRLNLAAAFDAAFVKNSGGLGNAAASVLREAGLPRINDLETLPWHGTPRLTRHAARPAGHRVFVVGDAASFVEPFTGEGMAWALASGAAVVPFAARGCREWDPALIGKWSARHRRIIRRRQLVCQAAACVLRHPKLVYFIVAALNRCPTLAAPVLGYINQGEPFAL
jgi:flavin-dependent dehydrogenase